MSTRPTHERPITRRQPGAIELAATAIVRFRVAVSAAIPPDEWPDECLRACQAGEYDDLEVESIEDVKPR